MKEIIVYTILCIFMVLFAFIGYKLSKGKWLRVISGNTFRPKKELVTDEMRHYAKQVGKVAYVCIILSFACGADSFFSKHAPELSWIGTALLIISTGLLVLSLVIAIPNHPDIKGRKK